MRMMVMADQLWLIMTTTMMASVAEEACILSTHGHSSDCKWLVVTLMCADAELMMNQDEGDGGRYTHDDADKYLFHIIVNYANVRW